MLLPHCSADLVKSIVVVVNASDDLPVDEFSGDLVDARVVPGREQFLAVEQAPRGGRLEPALTAHQLFAFSYRVHHVFQSTAQ